MTIGAGTRLGPYEVLAPLGAGGMGEVWKARDTRLDRSVAIKVLPAEFAENAQLKLRFEREAKTISQLNHPNICTLYDVGDGYLVMELLDGESLADRLTRGPLPPAEVLKYGVQIAEALGKAHRQGIVHRDLKPANVMLTKSGAKLLDFGLAKPRAAVDIGLDGPTVQKALTQEGTIVGTFQYMAPEQLEGSEPDPRTDIFALGCVLYEMTTGRRAFEGSTKTSLIAAIVSAEPKPMSELQPLTPPALEHVVRKCLTKDPDGRWQSAADIAEELRWISETGSGAGISVPLTISRRNRERLAWSLAALLALALAVAAPLYWRAISQAPRLMRFSIPLPPNTDTFRFDGGGMAISPDGTRLVVSLRTVGIGRQLYIRAIDSSEAVLLPETRGGTVPFWSPDGKFIGFFAEGKLKKISAAGGPPQVICDAPSGRGGTWNRDGTILFAPNVYSPLSKVSAAGGTPSVVTKLDAAHEVTHRYPSFLPDGDHFLFLAQGPGDQGVHLGSLGSPKRELLLDGASNTQYVQPGWILFARGESLFAIRFDVRKLKTVGEPIGLPIGKVGYYKDKDLSFFTAADDGTIVYLPPSRPLTRLQWLDRDGKVIASEEEPGYYVSGSISPDGKRIAFTRADAIDSNRYDIWLHEIGTPNTSRFTYDGHYRFVRWSHDGKRLFFTSTRKGVSNIYSRAVVGSAQEDLVFESPRFKEVFDLSPDDRTLIASEQFPDTNEDLMAISVADHRSSPFVRTPGTDSYPAFSPDGKWVAYTSGEVYVRRFPDTGEQWQVSSAGGSHPKWSHDGKELYYDGAGMLMSVPLRLGATLEAGPPHPLFRFDPTATPEGIESPVLAIDSRGRFLVVAKSDNSTPPPFNVVLNWTQLLEKK